MRVKCLAQEHNTMNRPGLKCGPLNQESKERTISSQSVWAKKKLSLNIFLQFNGEKEPPMSIKVEVDKILRKFNRLKVRAYSVSC